MSEPNLFPAVIVRERFERIGTISNLENVFERIRNGDSTMVVGGVTLSLEGLRLQTFASSELCCSDPNCETKPEYFAIERTLDSTHPEFSRFHLNLYGVNKNGYETLFTHDHTLARALGGADDRENTTLMCGPCNFRKARVEGKEVVRRREEDERLNHPERYALRKKLEADRALKVATKKLDNMLNGAGHFLQMDRESLVAHANAQVNDGFVNNKTAYANAGLTPNGYKWLARTTMEFFKANQSTKPKSKKAAL